MNDSNKGSCDSEFEKAFNEAVGEICVILNEELQAILNRKRGMWVRPWSLNKHITSRALVGRSCRV